MSVLTNPLKIRFNSFAMAALLGLGLIACAQATDEEPSTATSSSDDGALVILETTLGDITLELDADAAPETVDNFLTYVDDGFYDDLIFHRVISGFMIQGGGFDDEMSQKTPRDPIQNESDNGLSNDRGTIAMARTPDPHSATSQFFINVEDNANLNHRGSQWGYAVFGQVVDGMDVVDAIVSSETETLTTDMGPMGDVPVDTIYIERAYRP